MLGFFVFQSNDSTTKAHRFVGVCDVVIETNEEHQPLKLSSLRVCLVTECAAFCRGREIRHTANRLRVTLQCPKRPAACPLVPVPHPTVMCASLEGTRSPQHVFMDSLPCVNTTASSQYTKGGNPVCSTRSVSSVTSYFVFLSFSFLHLTGRKNYTCLFFSRLITVTYGQTPDPKNIKQMRQKKHEG